VLSLFSAILRGYSRKRGDHLKDRSPPVGPSDEPPLPRWLSTLSGVVTLTVLILLVVSALSLAAVIGLTTCSCWERLSDFLAHHGIGGANT